MTLILYIIIFSAVCLWRRRTLAGAHLKEKMHASGRAYLESLQTSNKGRTVTPSLGLAVDGAHAFVIRREKAYHRFLKSLGLAEEIQTGDSALDDKLFFVTETPDDFRQLLDMPQVREAIKRLFSGYKITDLRCFGRKIWIACAGMEKADYTQALAAVRLEALGTIANAAEALGRNSLREEGLLTKPRLVAFFMIVHAALFTLGILGGLPLFMETMEIVSFSKLVLTGSGVAAALAALWVYFVFFALGRTSWIPLVIGDFALMGIAGFFLSSVFVTREINMHFDQSPAEIHVRAVTGKQCEITCSRGSGKRRRSSTYQLSESQCKASTRDATRASYARRDSKCDYSSSFEYTLLVEPWLAEQTESFDFTVDAARYDQTKIGDKMQIPARRGALGLEWVDTAEIRPAK